MSFPGVPKAIGLFGLLAMALSQGAVAADLPGAPAAGLPIAALKGLDPVAVRAALAPAAASWPAPRAFEVATPEGRLSFIGVGELMTDPALAARMAAFRTQADRPPTDPYLQCRETLVRNGGAPEQAFSVVLMFRNGRLEGAFRPVEPPPATPPPVRDRKAMTAFMRRPVSSPFLARYGDLPLQDGAGFVSRWVGAALGGDDQLAATCTPPPPVPAPAPGHGHGLDASDMQGLALLPIAVTLPAKNAQRAAARREGAALLASIHIGEALGEPPQAFATHHRGVRAYRARQGDYVVLSIDLGGYPSGNLSNFNDSALVGVRDGRVEWLSPPASLGPTGGLLCLDDQGVPNAPRPGCAGWGHFSP